MKYFFLILGASLLVIGLIDLQKSMATTAKAKWDWSHFVIVTMSELVIAAASLYLAYIHFTRLAE